MSFEPTSTTSSRIQDEELLPKESELTDERSRQINRLFLASNISISSPSSIPAKNGRGGYSEKLLFYPEASNIDDEPMSIQDDELVEKLAELPGVDEEIVSVRIWRSKLFGWSLTSLWCHNLFLGLQTKNWWWTIEKDSNGVTIQRSKSSDRVINFLRGVSRVEPIAEVDASTGRGSIKNLMENILNRNLWQVPYFYVHSSFVADIFKLASADEAIANHFQKFDKFWFQILTFVEDETTENKMMKVETEFEKLTETDPRMNEDVSLVKIFSIESHELFFVELKTKSNSCCITTDKIGHTTIAIAILFDYTKLFIPGRTKLVEEVETTGATIKSIFKHLIQVNGLQLEDKLFCDEIINYCAMKS